jgi:hypothetical protein
MELCISGRGSVWTGVWSGGWITCSTACVIGRSVRLVNIGFVLLACLFLSCDFGVYQHKNSFTIPFRNAETAHQSFEIGYAKADVLRVE